MFLDQDPNSIRIRIQRQANPDLKTEQIIGPDWGQNPYPDLVRNLSPDSGLMSDINFVNKIYSGSVISTDPFLAVSSKNGYSYSVNSYGSLAKE